MADQARHDNFFEIEISGKKINLAYIIKNSRYRHPAASGPEKYESIFWVIQAGMTKAENPRRTRANIIIYFLLALVITTLYNF